MKNGLKLLTIIFVFMFTLSNAFAADVYLYVTRHGKTMFNTAHRVQGWSDTPLTQPGIDVATQSGRGLKDIDFISVYSSDLGRARQTARVILDAKGDQKTDIIEMPSLRETCFGLFEGNLDPNMWHPAAKYLGYVSDKALMDDFAVGEITIDKMMDKPIRSQLGNASVTKIRYTDQGQFIVESVGDMSYVKKGQTR